ncbi:MAG: RDD family protein [Bryobacteraceae bacterium]|nr:RDD family protein [Bryobacteraceae bacterium]
MPLEYAALPRRGAAFLIDAVLLVPAALLASQSPWLAGAAAVLWWTAFEASPWQASPGKRLLGMRTIEADGRKVGFGRALGRSVLKALPLAAVPVWPWAAAAVGAAAAVLILVDRRRRSYPDLLVRTAVIVPPKDVGKVNE